MWGRRGASASLILGRVRPLRTGNAGTLRLGWREAREACARVMRPQYPVASVALESEGRWCTCTFAVGKSRSWRVAHAVTSDGGARHERESYSSLRQ